MKKEMNLTERIYALEYVIGMFFYGIGILLVTPPTSNPFFKNMIVLLVCLVGVIGGGVQFKQSHEKIDERAKNNFVRASNTTLIIFICLLIIFGSLFQLLTVKINFFSGIIFFMLATICVIHASAFKKFEQSGNS